MSWHMRQMMVCVAMVGVSTVGVERVALAAHEQGPAPAARGDLHGSWIVTYDVSAFGAPFDLLLSFGDEGVVFETDAPGAFPLGPISVVLSNGHGAWQPTKGKRTFAYVYRKLVFQQDGLTPFGTTRTEARGSLAADGATFTASLVIQIMDGQGTVLFEANGTAGGVKIDVVEP